MSGLWSEGWPWPAGSTHFMHLVSRAYGLMGGAMVINIRKGGQVKGEWHHGRENCHRTDLRGTLRVDAGLRSFTHYESTSQLPTKHTNPHTTYVDLNCRGNKGARSSHHPRSHRRCCRRRSPSPPSILSPSSQMAILPFLTTQSQSIGRCFLSGSWNGHSG